LLTSAEWAGDTLFMYPFTGGAFTVISFRIAVIFDLGPDYQEVIDRELRPLCALCFTSITLDSREEKRVQVSVLLLSIRLQRRHTKSRICL